MCGAQLGSCDARVKCTNTDDVTQAPGYSCGCESGYTKKTIHTDYDRCVSKYSYLFIYGFGNLEQLERQMEKIKQ